MSDAEQQARSQVESIVEMIAALRNAETESDEEAAETTDRKPPFPSYLDAARPE
jgi:hypothetical protein